VKQLSTQVIIFGPFRLEFSSSTYLHSLTNYLEFWNRSWAIWHALQHFCNQRRWRSSVGAVRYRDRLFPPRPDWSCNRSTGPSGDPGHNADIQRLGKELSRFGMPSCATTIHIRVNDFFVHDLADCPGCAITHWASRSWQVWRVSSLMRRARPSSGSSLPGIPVPGDITILDCKPGYIPYSVIGLSVLLDQAMDNLVVQGFMARP